MASPQVPPPIMPPPMYVRPYRRRSVAGPVVLITIGVVFLLANMHLITWGRLAFMFGHYWPVLLILWGLIKLVEHLRAQSEGYPAPGIGAGGVVFIIFLIMFGMAATEGNKVNWQSVGDEIDSDGDLSSLFGTTYEYTDQLEQPYTAGASIHVVSDRGDVTVTASDDQKVRVVVHKKVVAGDEDKAKEVNGQTKPVITADNGTININANTTGGVTKTGFDAARPVSSDLEIFVPRMAAIDISLRRGDVVVRGRDAAVKAATAKGDVTVEDVKGDVTEQLRGGSVRNDQVTGDVTLSADRIDDVTISNIGGAVHISGEITGTTKLSKVTKGVGFTSSRTDMHFGKLDGDLTMDLSELRANQLDGPFRIATRSKDIHLDDVNGDVKIENSNGEVNVTSTKLPLGAVDIDNRNGQIELTVPATARFTLEARARRGDIDTSDFNDVKQESRDGDATANGSVGGGGVHVLINNDRGGIQVKKAG